MTYLFIKNILTKTYKKSKIINTLVFVLGFILILIANIYCWNKIKNRKELSASEYFSNANITDLTDEELNEWNDEKDMMNWLKEYNSYQHNKMYEVIM